ncbi:nucleotidyltransferase family protein [uncultured Pelagimonas sp.]|uniref:nucleotidyltransferase family protein n=1 Tax=uncultured Pelagimonas sp. TaxID=1618102 RepID=UPI00263A24E1|nr:nucleotidyltransferase family protein [uncultured Pelagimonas sp.]
MLDIAIVIPAAGASRRMRGQDKLLQDVGGVPMLRRQVETALATGAHVCVTLPDHDHPRAAALQGLPVQIVAVPDANLGMSASLRRGVGMLPRNQRAVMILPADMPDLTTEDLLAVYQGFCNEAHPTLQQATSADGNPGHPVLFPADCFTALMAVSGDQGARAVLKANKYRLRRVALSDDRALVDLDTPEAWAAWRAKTAEMV